MSSRNGSRATQPAESATEVTVAQLAAALKDMRITVRAVTSTPADVTWQAVPAQPTVLAVQLIEAMRENSA